MSAAAAGRSLWAFRQSAANRESDMKLTKNIGTLLLGAWLILTGLIGLTHLGFDGLWLIMAVLALAAGFFLIVGK